MDTVITESTVVIVEPVAEAQPTPVHWTQVNRLLFRVAFLYFCIFIFSYGNGSIFGIIPKVGNYFDTWATWPWQHAALWTGTHIFHLKGQSAAFHNTGSGDTALDWILQLLYITFAVVGGLVWTVVSVARGNRRPEYATLYAWLRFGVRLTVGFFMINYGIAKLFPFQMPHPSIAILTEPVGQMSPMTMLWAMLGLNTGYEMICGAAEILGGILILFRRTALAGSLLSAFVMTNVLLYNMYFDVPVKLFAANLLLAAVFITLPDIKPLYEFFWLHKLSAPVGIWIPPVRRRGFRIATRIVEGVFTVMFLIMMPGFVGYGWYQHTKDLKKTSPLFGAWHLDPSHPATGAFVTGEGLPATDLYVDDIHRAFTRANDLSLWRTYLSIDEKADTVTLYQTVGDAPTYSIYLLDNDHINLVTQAPKPDPKAKPDLKAKPFVPETISLTRTQVPNHFPLLDRGFHWVNEWGLER